MPKASLKEAIIDAAVDQFHEHGYNGTGVAAIAKAAGAPKGSFYNHFSSKEQLAIEVVNRYTIAMHPEMLADESLPPLERIKAHFDFIASTLQEFGHRRGCLLGNLAAETPACSQSVAQQVDEVFNVWVGLLSSAIELAQQDGSVPAEVEADLVANELIDLYEGFILRGKATGNPGAVERVLNHALPRLLDIPSLPGRSSTPPGKTQK